MRVLAENEKKIFIMYTIMSMRYSDIFKLFVDLVT